LKNESLELTVRRKTEWGGKQANDGRGKAMSGKVKRESSENEGSDKAVSE
jgi:hypothetical protein